MFINRLDNTQRSHERHGARQLLPFFIALLFALTILPGKAHAQIVGDLEANIPFQFHAGDAKFPAGNYVIRMLDSSDLTVMEISSADGSTSALLDVQATEASSAPTKSEFIFNRYGNHYFLAKLYDAGEPDGSQVSESRYEKRIVREAAETQEHVPAHHATQRGN